MVYGIGQYIVDNRGGALAGLGSNVEDSSIITPNQEPNTVKKKNIIGDQIPVNAIHKLGIQAQPDSLFYIGGMPIKVGRTGTYEVIFNHVAITDLSFTTEADSQRLFIVDYKYIISE